MRHTGSRFARLQIASCVIGFCLALAGSSHAAISTTGNVTPNPQTTTSSSSLYIGQSAPGTMLVNAGSDVLSGAGYIADFPGTTGAATVDGAGSTWKASGTMYVGNRGSGSLDVTAGAFVSNGPAYIGNIAGSSGDVNVDGMGSIWSNSGALTVGNGTLDITNGGQVKNDFPSQSQSSSIGSLAGGSGTVTVDGIGSQWANNGGLTVADGGTLTIRNGGQVSNRAAIVGPVAGGTSAVSVDGVGSIWSSLSLSIGGATGSVSVANGAQLTVTTSLSVSPNGSPSLLLDNSQATVGGTTTLPLNTSSYGIVLNNSTLTTNSLAGFLTELGGNGVVNTHGLIANMDLVFDATHEVQQQFIINSGASQNVTVNLDANSSGVLGAAYDGAGTLTIKDGITVSSAIGEIGYRTGSNGIATVDGVATKWNMTGDLKVGGSGQGTLSIEAGARVSNNNGLVGNSAKPGAVTVSGVGSLWANTQDVELNNGSLQVLGGGKVTSRNGEIGRLTSAVAAVIIDGENSSWLNSGSIYVGRFGNGSLTIANGALATSGNGYVGDSGTGTAHVVGAGSAWTCTGTLHVSSGDNGILQITNGGTVNSSAGSVGGYPGSTGEVTVDGGTSSWNMTNDLLVGAAGTLNIVNGARVSVGTSTTARDNDGPGLINFDGGTLTTKTLLAGATALKGTGIVNTQGLVTDGDIVPAKVSGVWQPLHVGGQTNHNLTINLNLDGAMELGAGFDGQGTLTIANGVEAKSIDGSLGYNAGSTGIAHLTGLGSAWDVSGLLKVGRYGAGTLEITNSAKLNTLSTYISEGSSTGDVTVSGAGSEWINDWWLSVGVNGHATLTVSDGGKATTTKCEIGSQYSATGIVHVTGAGSSLVSASNGSFYVGNTGDGTLSITDGGAVSNAWATVADDAGSNSAATVSDPGSTWTMSQNLTLGYAGIAVLGIENGGVVDVTGNVTLGSAAGGKGTVNLTGGTLHLHGGTLSKGSGTATFNLTGGRLEGAGTISLGAPFVQSGGTFAPGNPQGTTTITGGYTLDTGKLEFDLNGVPSPLKDQVTVTGQVNLLGANGVADGVLNLVLEFAPSIGSQFLLISNDGTDAVVGTFASGSIAKAAFNNALYTFGINYATNVGNNDVVLTTQSVGVLGDFSGDGVVDGGDYLVWRKSLGGNVNRFFGADGNGNGTIDDGDYEVWRSRFGTTTAGLGTSAIADVAVPEPTTLALVAMLLLLVLPRYGAFHSWRTLPS